MKKKLKTKKLKAFSLIEMIVAISIFSLVMTAVVSVFINMVKTQKTAKNMQSDLESARGALEVMAKNIRMSTVDSATSSEIDVFNYSQSKCINYKFSDITKKITTREVFVPQRAQLADCSGADYSQESELISTGVEDFKFNVDKSTNSTVGKAVIWLKMTVTPDPFETTVSLRDYKD